MQRFQVKTPKLASLIFSMFFHHVFSTTLTHHIVSLHSIVYVVCVCCLRKQSESLSGGRKRSGPWISGILHLTTGAVDCFSQSCYKS